MYKAGVFIAAGVTLAILFIADVIARRSVEPHDEKDEQARKNLIENQEKDINLDAE